MLSYQMVLGVNRFMDSPIPSKTVDTRYLPKAIPQQKSWKIDSYYIKQLRYLWAITQLIWFVDLTPLKNISQLGWLFPYIVENKTCLKPPTSNL